MIRKLVTVSRRSRTTTPASSRNLTSRDHLQLCRLGSSIVYNQNVMIGRMFSQFNKFPLSNIPFPENFIDGPMMPREKVKKKKKKKPKPEKIVPPMDSIEQCLEKMRIRFDEIEKEHLGPSRGIRTVKWIAGRKCEGLHKTVTTKMANSILNSWVYCRHALQHGHYQLNDMTKKEFAESLLGKGTKTKVDPRDGRIMLKELFRFGKSNVAERYLVSVFVVIKGRRCISAMSTLFSV
jgi:hypothetical protein